MARTIAGLAQDHALSLVLHTDIGGATQERTALTAATAHLHGNTKVAEFRQLRNSGRSETERASLGGMATRGGDRGAELAALLAKEAVTATT